MTRKFAILIICWLGLPAAAASSRTARESGTVGTAPGVNVYYERFGNGPNLVLIPNRMFMPEFIALARSDRTLVLYDMRNRGRSSRVEDPGKITIFGDIEDVEALRKHFGADKMSLVGYSYLGLMTALYASQHPTRVARLVQVGSVPRKFGTPYPADQQAGHDTLSAEGVLARQAWQAISRDASAPPEVRCHALSKFVSFLLVGNPMNHAKVPNTCQYENESVASAERHLRAHFGDLQTRDFPRETFTKLRIPVLTIHGTMDRNAPYGSGLEWAAMFQDGRLITIAGAAHQLWLDDPAVIGEIDEFLSGKWPGRAQRFGRD